MFRRTEGKNFSESVSTEKKLRETRFYKCKPELLFLRLLYLFALDVQNVCAVYSYSTICYDYVCKCSQSDPDYNMRLNFEQENYFPPCEIKESYRRRN